MKSATGSGMNAMRTMKAMRTNRSMRKLHFAEEAQEDDPMDSELEDPDSMRTQSGNGD
jgi:hypothetical protein